MRHVEATGNGARTIAPGQPGKGQRWRIWWLASKYGVRAVREPNTKSAMQKRSRKTPVGGQQKMMRHADTSTTINFYGTAQKEMRKAAEAIVRISAGFKPVL